MREIEHLSAHHDRDSQRNRLHQDNFAQPDRRPESSKKIEGQKTDSEGQQKT
jgi:hypothetical protein